MPTSTDSEGAPVQPAAQSTLSKLNDFHIGDGPPFIAFQCVVIRNGEPKREVGKYYLNMANVVFKIDGKPETVAVFHKAVLLRKGPATLFNQLQRLESQEPGKKHQRWCAVVPRVFAPATVKRLLQFLVYDKYTEEDEPEVYRHGPMLTQPPAEGVDHARSLRIGVGAFMIGHYYKVPNLKIYAAGKISEAVIAG